MVVGNYIGTDLTGTKAVPNMGDGVYDAAGANNTIGGTTPAERNIISGNASYGIELLDAGNVASGNFIGTDVTGTHALGNGLAGVKADGANGIIGGAASGAGNLISGNNGPGVDVTYDSYVVEGNQIGLDANGNPLGNAGDGVLIHQVSSNRPGAAVAQGNVVVSNTIAFNLGNGVAVTAFDASLGAGTGNSISSNSIFGNQQLGIDLGDDGVTSNHERAHDRDRPEPFAELPGALVRHLLVRPDDDDAARSPDWPTAITRSNSSRTCSLTRPISARARRSSVKEQRTPTQAAT